MGQAPSLPDIFFGSPNSVMAPISASMTHDNILHAIGVGDGAELEPFFFAGRLDMDIAIVEECLEESVHFDGDILHPCQFELAYFAGEEPMLFDIDDAVARNDPDVEPDIDPNEEDIKPGEEEKGVLDEEEELPVLGSKGVREEHRERDEGEEECPHEKKDGEKMHENIEPVPMGYFEDALFGSEKIIEWLHKGRVRDTGC